MIKCNVTVCGIINRDASTKTNKEGKTFLTFPLRVTVPATEGQSVSIYIDVSMDEGAATGYRKGLRVVAMGTMFLKRRGEKLYFNLSADDIRREADMNDSVEGELVFRGNVGQNIEERKDKKDQPYTLFSAFSAEKVGEGFEYQWVRFFCFGRQREAWLQPGVRIDAKGEMNLSAHNGKLNLSCRVDEIAQHIEGTSNFNQ